MASATGSSNPLTTAQFTQLQALQRAAQTFLKSADGSTGKTNLKAFQVAFNQNYSALSALMQARGNPANLMQNQVPGSIPVTADGLWGPQSAWALGYVILFSFPASVAQQAVVDLLTVPVVQKKAGAAPLPRAQIASAFLPKYSAQIANMVINDYSSIATSANSPVVTQNTTADTVNNASASSSTTAAQAPTVIDEEPLTITAPAPVAKSLTWLWVTLGLGTVGVGLWWMFGRKGH
jgi:hypothetical protein